MARPAKSTAVKNHDISKAAKEEQKLTEKKLKGKTNRIKAPEYLTESQKEVYNFIITELKSAEILGNIDLVILVQTSVVVDNMNRLIRMMNEDPELSFDTKYVGAFQKYSGMFMRYCNELCLSPQSRAKMSIAHVNAIEEAKKKNPILGVLDDD